MKSAGSYMSPFPSFWALAQSVFMMSQCLSLFKFTLHGNDTMGNLISPFASRVWHVLRLVSKEIETNVQQLENMRGFRQLVVSVAVSLTIYWQNCIHRFSVGEAGVVLRLEMELVS